MKKNTEKTKAELIEELEALRSKLAEALDGKYARIADKLPQFVFEIDTRGKLLYANDFALNNYGYTKEDIYRGLALSDVIHQDDIQRVQSNMAKTLAGAPLQRQTYTAQRRDGSTFPVKVYAERIIENGQVTGVRAYFSTYPESRRRKTRCAPAKTITARCSKTPGPPWPSSTTTRSFKAATRSLHICQAILRPKFRER